MPPPSVLPLDEGAEEKGGGFSRDEDECYNPKGHRDKGLEVVWEQKEPTLLPPPLLGEPPASNGMDDHVPMNWNKLIILIIQSIASALAICGGGEKP